MTIKEALNNRQLSLTMYNLDLINHSGDCQIWVILLQDESREIYTSIDPQKTMIKDDRIILDDAVIFTYGNYQKVIYTNYAAVPTDKILCCYRL